MRIYITHCSKRKDSSLRASGKKVTPNKLYTAPLTQDFMRKCIEEKVHWAIFSDLYGIWYPDIEHGWYEKDPDTITDQEFANLVSDFNQKLQHYDEVWFFYDPDRFHPIYEKLLQQTNLKERIKMFSDLNMIVNDKT
jgi:hypothetical protein